MTKVTKLGEVNTFSSKKKSETAKKLFRKISARSETRTRTDISAQRILSPSCLPFHHSSDLGAENETRTRDPNLGKVVLYQLSYFRK